MGVLGLSLLLAAPGPDDGLAKRMLPVYVREVEGYSIAVGSAPDKPLELKREPVFEWLNEARGNNQGAVFVWLRDGRPAALAGVFSYPHDRLPGRMVVHELHALDRERLSVERDDPNEWKPEAGLVRRELPDAGPPAATPAARLAQMRKLAQEFAGHSVDRDGKRWELRLLPAPLVRYPSAKTGVVDGALFALVSTAGTDPEVLLVIEAVEAEGKLRWEYACGRFSDWELRVSRNGKEVYASVPGEKNTTFRDPLHLYRNFATKVVTPEGKVLARFRPVPGREWGQLVPVEGK